MSTNLNKKKTHEYFMWLALQQANRVLGNTKDNRTPLIETYKIPPTKKLLASGFKI